MDAKRALRERVWHALQECGAARFPGAHGRIPNFAGAEQAAQQLTRSKEWKRARGLKCNPDSPQRSVRHAALEAGKVVYMAGPRLRDPKPFIELDPMRLGEKRLWAASSIRGATALGRPVAPQEMAGIDLVVTGCVAVTRDGARLGKGGGFSDLEYAVLRELRVLDEETPVATTVHPLQLLQPGAIPMMAHDISLDLIATPEGVLRCPRSYARPRGLLWNELGSDQLESIPLLRVLKQRR